MVIANDGVMIIPTGSMITCSSGDAYLLSGGMLQGPSGVVSTGVGSIAEAVCIVAGLHGGRRF